MWHPVTGGVLPTHMHTSHTYINFIFTYYILHHIHTSYIHVPCMYVMMCVYVPVLRMYVKVSGGK